MRTVLSIFFLVFFSIHSDALASQNAVFTHQTWDLILKRHVHPIDNGLSSQVDYAALKRNHKDLDAYLSSLSEIKKSDFDTWPDHDQLAFLINAYNAWTVKLILKKYPDLESIKELGSFFQSPWKKRFIPLLGKLRSLDNIEHKLIRGSDNYNEARIHFAVNCASIGCPALRREAYIGERLDQQLDNATHIFLSNRKRNKVENGVLKLSPIFSWYSEDFDKFNGKTQSLEDFLLIYSKSLRLDVQQQTRLKSGRMDIRFLDYDWKLNHRP